MKSHNIIENYRDDAFLRNSFFDFVQKVFPGLNFQEWFLKGYWRDNYIPFSIVENDMIVANVSITKMKIYIDGELINGIQFGTVGTIPEYRNRGLSRYLMDYVLDKYGNSADLIFLFANESVVDFYPRFGFTKCDEIVFKAESDIPKSRYSARQLDIRSKTDIAIIEDLLKHRLPLTKLFGALEYDFITLWHILNIFPEKLFYLDKDEIIFIVSEDKAQLHIWDIIYRKPFELLLAMSQVIKSDDIKTINYYFSPDQLNFKYDRVAICNDSPLFVRGMFTINDRPFKFPVTAQT